MNRLVVVALLFIGSVSVAFSQDTANVSCWNGQPKGYHAQRVRGAVSVSEEKTKAFVSVTASTTPEGGCTNLTHLYIQKPKGEFRAVYEGKPHDAYNGNGMRLLGWTGHRLLAEAIDWVHQSDAPPVQSVVIYDETTGEAKAFDTTGAMLDHFGGQCVAVISLRGWDGADALLLRASPPAKLAEGQTACVQKPAMFSIGLEDGAVKERR